VTAGAWLPLAIVASSLLPGIIIFLLPERASRARVLLNLGGATAKVAFVIVLLESAWRGEYHEARLELVEGLDLVLRVDSLALLFVSLSALLWFLTTIYAISYFGRSANLNRFFGFFSVSVAATTGIALAGNPMTFFFFYELLTLSTYPLVVHKGTPEALAAGRKYLAYTMTGSAFLLLGIVWLTALAGPLDFGSRASVAPLVETHSGALAAIFVLMIGGLGVKAALMPLHSWLPAAMVAPAPVSALLHAVAVVKAGAFGILRVIFDVFGIDQVAAMGFGVPLAVVASVTILYGSLLALAQVDLKRRLAFSTVSQVSYIVLGASLLGPAAAVGGLVHLVHQGLMKVTMFFCAGAWAETVHAHRIDELDGIGARMPWTTLSFSIAALGMIGLPPIAGFVSKWYLGIGGLQAGQPWVVVVLAASSLLNAMYFLPILYRAWFKPARGPWPEVQRTRTETRVGLWIPPVLTAAAALLVGLFAGFFASPLGWAQLIVERVYLLP
jgi:multicomponent Na+:H+ antiporter subunit D